MNARRSKRDDAEKTKSKWGILLLWTWVGLITVWIFNQARWVFPSENYSILSLLVSTGLGWWLYWTVINGRDWQLKTKAQRRIVLFMGPIIYPVFLWLAIHRPIPILMDELAVAPLDTTVVISEKDVSSRGHPCRRMFVVREFGILLRGRFCVDSHIFDQARPGDKLQLMGRQNALAWYVESARIESQNLPWPKE